MSTPKYPNRDALRQAHDIYLDAMCQFVKIRDALGMAPHDDREKIIEISDIAHLVRTYWTNFKGHFDAVDPHYEARSAIGLIVEGRNRASHPPWDLDIEFTRTQLFLIAEVLEKINMSAAQREVETIRDKLFDDTTKQLVATAVEVEKAKYEKSIAEVEKRLASAEASNKKLSKQIINNAVKLDEKKEELEKLSKRLVAAKLDGKEYEKQINSTSKQLEEVRTEHSACEERLTTISSQLMSTKAKRDDCKERLETALTELESVKVERSTFEERLTATSNELASVQAKKNASERYLAVTQNLLTTVGIGDQAVFPHLGTDATVRIVDRRGTDKRNYLVKLIEQKQPTLIYVQSKTMVNNLLKLVGPEKEGVIGKHDEQTSEAEEIEILEKLDGGELMAAVSNTTFSTLTPSHCVEHFVLCHLVPGVDEFYKRCEPVFASAKNVYLHLIYESKQDIEEILKKYLDEPVLRKLYEGFIDCTPTIDTSVNPEHLYSELCKKSELKHLAKLGIETGFSIFEELGFLKQNEEGIKRLSTPRRELKESEIYCRGEKLKKEIANSPAFQYEQSIEQIGEEILGALDIDLEKYLLKSNVASGEAEVDAEIVLKEEETSFSEVSSIDSEVSNPNDIDDKQSVTKQPMPPSKFSGKWTMERVRNSLSEAVRDYHQKNYPEERCNIFYRRVVEMQNLIEAEGWRLKPPKFNKGSCSFQLMDKGITRVRIVFGILLDTFLPHANLVDRNGEKIPDLSIKSNPPRIFAPITEEEAKQLERQHGCEFWGITERKIYYNIPDDITALRPVLEFAYNKHRGQ